MAEPHDIGTMARIIESTHLPNGSLNIIAIGVERFRILRVLHDQPYLRGEVETAPLPKPTDLGLVSQLADRVRAQVARYIKLIAEAAGLQIQVDQMPDTPQQIGYLAAVTMQIDSKEKQRLLMSSSLGMILAHEMTLLNRENALLSWMINTKGWPEHVQFGPSNTLLPN